MVAWLERHQVPLYLATMVLGAALGLVFPAATAAWAAIHGVASLASRGVLDLVGTDAQELLDQILPQD